MKNTTVQLTTADIPKILKIFKPMNFTKVPEYGELLLKQFAVAEESAPFEQEIDGGTGNFWFTEIDRSLTSEDLKPYTYIGTYYGADWYWDSKNKFGFNVFDDGHNWCQIGIPGEHINTLETGLHFIADESDID